MNNSEKSIFICCEKCGKKLIERLPNGIWRFVFGKDPLEGGSPPIEMFIHGNVKMKCIRRTCRHWNLLTFFPNTFKD